MRMTQSISINIMPNKLMDSRVEPAGRLVIFSDLDGCLLDREDYSFKRAAVALRIIRQRKIPLVLITSKTRYEVEFLISEMGMEMPFVTENGAAVFFPPGYRKWELPQGESDNIDCLIRLGKSYAEIRAFIERMSPRFKIKGFGDLSVQQIADLTGLTFSKAVLARQREFSEPFLIEDENDLEGLEYYALKEKLKITKGGRFYHLISVHQGKGEAVKILKRIVKRNMGENVQFVGIGDSANDVPMLLRMDIPVLIPRADGTFEPLDMPNLVKARLPGSAGWNETVLDILSDTHINN